MRTLPWIKRKSPPNLWPLIWCIFYKAPTHSAHSLCYTWGLLLDGNNTAKIEMCHWCSVLWLQFIAFQLHCLYSWYTNGLFARENGFKAADLSAQSLSLHDLTKCTVIATLWFHLLSLHLRFSLSHFCFYCYLHSSHNWSFNAAIFDQFYI